MNRPNSDTDPRAHLAHKVTTFRDRNGLAQSTVTNRGGPSVPTIRRIERGQPVDQATLTKLDLGLGWAPGTARAILDGHDPALPDAVTPASGITIGFLPDFEQLPRLQQERIRAAAYAAAVEKLAEVDAARAQDVHTPPNG